MTEKYYKVLEDNESCNGGDFNWKNYLPKNNRKGKWTPEINDCSICSRGYHLTSNPKEWLTKNNIIYEAEPKNIIDKNKDKVVCSSVRLIKKVTFNTGKNNTGEWNSGDRNSGNWNSGDWNSGYSNSGNSNSGYSNSGYSNSGEWNSGDWNSGDSNSGNSNSGDWNSGKWNSGYSNSGNRNSGNWNSSDYNTGAFNSNEPKIRLFNKPISLNEYKRINFPNYFYFNLTAWITYTEEEIDNDKHKKATGGYLKVFEYKEAWKLSFDNASIDEVKTTILLPNFDYNVFFSITGISEKDIKKRLNQKNGN